MQSARSPLRCKASGLRTARCPRHQRPPRGPSPDSPRLRNASPGPLPTPGRARRLRGRRSRCSSVSSRERGEGGAGSTGRASPGSRRCRAATAGTGGTGPPLTRRRAARVPEVCVGGRPRRGSGAERHGLGTIRLRGGRQGGQETGGLAPRCQGRPALRLTPPGQPGDAATRPRQPVLTQSGGKAPGEPLLYPVRPAAAALRPLALPPAGRAG